MNIHSSIKELCYFVYLHYIVKVNFDGRRQRISCDTTVSCVITHNISLYLSIEYFATWYINGEEQASTKMRCIYLSEPNDIALAVGLSGGMQAYLYATSISFV